MKTRQLDNVGMITSVIVAIHCICDRCVGPVLYPDNSGLKKKNVGGLNHWESTMMAPCGKEKLRCCY